MRDGDHDGITLVALSTAVLFLLTGVTRRRAALTGKKRGALPKRCSGPCTTRSISTAPNFLAFIDRRVRLVHWCAKTIAIWSW
jgi:hypothetical protein